MSISEKKKQLNRALGYFFDCDMNQTKACEKAGISTTTLCNELHNYHVCHCRECSEEHPCRAAKRGMNGIMFCGALKETYDSSFCPFFKTQLDYEKEFRETNLMTIWRMENLGYLQKGEVI